MTFKSLDDEKVTSRTDLKICDEIDTATFSDNIGNVTTPARTLFISGLKSRVLQLPFFT